MWCWFLAFGCSFDFCVDDFEPLAVDYEMSGVGFERLAAVLKFELTISSLSLQFLICEVLISSVSLQF